MVAEWATRVVSEEAGATYDLGLKEATRRMPEETFNNRKRRTPGGSARGVGAADGAGKIR